MINLAEQSTSIPIPIEFSDHQQAFQFAQQQPTASKAEQVYRNTLAVLVTQKYLHQLGIETITDKSQSWNPLNRVIENVADLYVPYLNNSLECRPITKSDHKVALRDHKCIIPKEVHTEHSGYVFVQLDAPYKIGYLVGFVKSVSVSELPLSYLQPLDQLIDLFLDKSVPDSTPQPLRQWLNNLFTSNWQPPSDLLEIMGKTIFPTPSFANREEVLRRRIENLYRQQPKQVATLTSNVNYQEALVNLIETTEDDNIRWQSAELLWKINPLNPACPIITAKDLGLYLMGYNLALAIGILPKPDNTLLILTRIYPLTESSYLPQGLKFIGLDEQEDTFFEIVARQQDNYIQFKFNADEGDRFSLQIKLNEAIFTESFII